MTRESRICQNCKQSFAIEPDDFSFYEKMKVPPPTFCWLCRAQRRMSFRNERILHKRKSDFSGKDIFSMYAPDSGYKVYEKDVWFSDQWDPLTYGRDYDFNRPFFEQFNELLHEVPLRNLNVLNAVRSDYTSNFTDPKNCYLCFNGNYCEDCMYSHGLSYCRDCVDVSHLSKCETCYGSFWLNACNNTFFSNNCDSSFNMWFSKDCTGCSNCFGCVGLRKKQYHIFNEPYDKESYAAKIKSFNLGSYDAVEQMKKRAQEFWLRFPNKFIEGLHNTNVSGNYVDHSKNVRNSLFVREGENLRFCQYLQELPGSKECYDYSVWGDNNEFIYECHACGLGTQNLRFCLLTQEDAHDMEYSVVCNTTSHLFGCVGLRKKQYCILNKQYSKEEYEALVPKIRAHMKTMPYKDKQGRVYAYGEYFPIEMSPVAYNESMAQEYFPLTKEAALAQGYKWRDTAQRDYKITIKSQDLPNDIHDVQDAITEEVIGCGHEGKCNQLCVTAFRITPDELTFYRKIGVPLPRLCHNCRTFERLKQRTGLKLYDRACACAGARSENSIYSNTVKHFHEAGRCPNKFETAYRPDQPEIVYCEQCYQAEVV